MEPDDSETCDDSGSPSPSSEEIEDLEPSELVILSAEKSPVSLMYEQARQMVPTHRESESSAATELETNSAAVAGSGKEPSSAPTAEASDEISTEDFRAFVEGVRSLVKAARFNAETDFAARFAVSFVTQDRVGALADLAQRLVPLRGNVKGATMAVIADQVASVLLVSGPGTVEDAEIRVAVESLRQRTEENESMFDARDDSPAPSVIRLDARQAEWPRPGSMIWHVRTTIPDRPGSLHHLLKAIAEFDVPVVSFSTWIENRELCVIDLNYAVQPDLEDEQVAASVRSSSSELGSSSVTVHRVTNPVRHQAQEVTEATPNRVVAISVVGPARPGLIASVTKGIFEGPQQIDMDLDTPLPFNIVGSAMSILEGHSAFVALIQVPDKLLGDRRRALELVRLAATRHLTDPAVITTEPYWLPAGGNRPRPQTITTHRLNCRGPEEPEILASVTRAVADADINIVWLSDRTIPGLEPDIGGMCELQLDLAFPEDISDAVDLLRSALERLPYLRWELIPVGAHG